jgi:hypothetical protein
MGKIIEGLSRLLGPLVEGVGGVVGNIVTGLGEAQDRSEWQSSPQGKKTLESIMSNFSKLAPFSVSPDSGQAQTWAIKMATKGKELTAGITKADVEREKIPTSVVISGNTIHLTESQRMEVVAAKRNNNWNVFTDANIAAAQLVILSHPASNAPCHDVVGCGITLAQRYADEPTP